VNLVIPEPENPNLLAIKKFFACKIAYLASSIVMSAAVELNRQLYFRAVEIEDIRINWVLPPEFVTREIAVSQLAPQKTFPLGRMPAEILSAAHADI
jgi:hypothetical protein